MSDEEACARQTRLDFKCQHGIVLQTGDLVRLSASDADWARHGRHAASIELH